MTTPEPKKKILYVITKSNWGGAQRYVFNLATHFSGKYDVAVALGGDGTLKKRLEEAHIRTISIPGLGRDVGLGDFSVFSYLISLFKTEAPDIVHLNSSKIGAMGALAGRLAHVPRIIFTAHGWAFREERSGFAKFLIKLISWLTILWSHKVITVSERDEKEGREMPFAKNKIAPIHNGIADEPHDEKMAAREKIFRLSGLPQQERLHYLHDTHWIGTVGELHKNKGHTFALSALSKMPKELPFIFVIIGEGEERQSLLSEITALGLAGSVVLIGKRSDASELLSAFDVFLFPSVKEGLPYAILEAGLAELPVIASAVGGIPEVITDMDSGILVRPKDPQEIVKAFEFIFSHPQKMKNFGKRLHSVVKKDFSLTKMCRETAEVYKMK